MYINQNFQVIYIKSQFAINVLPENFIFSLQFRAILKIMQHGYIIMKCGWLVVCLDWALFTLRIYIAGG